MISQHHCETIGKYIIASPVDLSLALQYVQDGGLERTRLQQIYDKYGLTNSFTRDDVVVMFKDSYSGLQASKNVHQSILKPALDDLDDTDTPVLKEDRDYKPFNYYFNREPVNEIDFKKPEINYTILQQQYPDLPWNKIEKN